MWVSRRADCSKYTESPFGEPSSYWRRRTWGHVSRRYRYVIARYLAITLDVIAITRPALAARRDICRGRLSNTQRRYKGVGNLSSTATRVRRESLRLYYPLHLTFTHDPTTSIHNGEHCWIFERTGYRYQFQGSVVSAIGSIITTIVTAIADLIIIIVNSIVTVSVFRSYISPNSSWSSYRTRRFSYSFGTCSLIFCVAGAVLVVEDWELGAGLGGRLGSEAALWTPYDSFPFSTPGPRIYPHPLVL